MSKNQQKPPPPYFFFFFGYCFDIPEKFWSNTHSLSHTHHAFPPFPSLFSSDYHTRRGKKREKYGKKSFCGSAENRRRKGKGRRKKMKYANVHVKDKREVAEGPKKKEISLEILLFQEQFLFLYFFIFFRCPTNIGIAVGTLTLGGDTSGS